MSIIFPPAASALAVFLRPDFIAAIYPVVTMADSRYVQPLFAKLALLGEWANTTGR